MALQIDTFNLNKVNYTKKSSTNELNGLQLNGSEIWHKTVNVTFMYDNIVYNTQNVRINGYAETPENPVVDGFSFVGWSVDGENIVDLSTYQIIADTTFVGIFIQSSIVVTLNNERTNFETMDEVITYIKGLETLPSNKPVIKMYKDASFTSTQILNRHFDLDLNGFTLKGGYFQFYSGAFNFYDSSVNKTGFAEFNYIDLQSGAKLSLSDIKLDILYRGISGGISMINGSVTMNNVIYTSKSSSSSAIYAKNYDANSSTSFTMNGGKIISNGENGIYAKGYSGSRKSYIYINSGEICDCGNAGIYVDSYADVQITDCKLSNNQNSGIKVKGESSTYKSSLKMTNCQILNNKYTGQSEGGAGIWTYNGSVTLTNCTFDGNQSASGGGALFIREKSSVGIYDCILSNNTAKQGGAIKIWDGSFTLQNTKLISNNATNAGGAIYTTDSYVSTIYLKGDSEISQNYLNNSISNILVDAKTTVNIYSNFTGSVGFTSASGTGKVAQFAESTQPVGATYLSDEGYNVTISGNDILLS